MLEKISPALFDRKTTNKNNTSTSKQILFSSNSFQVPTKFKPLSSDQFVKNIAFASNPNPKPSSNVIGPCILTGYYNSDGTYHSTSDNCDYDPETGALVRRW